MITKATYIEKNAKLNSTKVKQKQLFNKKQIEKKTNIEDKNINSSMIPFNNQKIIAGMEKENNQITSLLITNGKNKQKIIHPNIT